ncbi:MAG TPA: PTS sugar transporter subunit IIA [Candidatus Krumholzibacteria bacterium]|nr:PTS sugar transporter subunit IIA [Candidatus Krumholzibacteria bacterium]
MSIPDHIVAPDIGLFLTVGLVLLAGAAGGWVMRRLHMPAITGNILIGILLGPSALKLLSGEADIQAVRPLSVLAMGLISARIGAHLSYRRIHNALRRITGIALMEVLCSVVLVLAVCRLLHASWPTAILLAAISAATAPATSLALVREGRARGPFVKTLLSVVALDNMLCISLFALARILVANFYEEGGVLPHVDVALLNAGLQLGGALVIGVVIGKVTERFVRNPWLHDFSTVLVAILFCTGLSEYLGLSPLLTNMFFGVCLGNAPGVAQKSLDSLKPLEPLLYIAFFTLAGASFHMQALMSAGVLCAGYIVARAVAKGLGASLGGIMTRSSQRLWSNVSLALIPQAGVAIGLVVLLDGDARIPDAVSQAVGAVVLAAVAINEIIGPFFTRLALGRAREINLDRPRLIDFLHEEFILTDLKARDKWDAIRQLTAFLVRVHGIRSQEAEPIYDSIVEREQSLSTAIGHGVAIPHGRISDGAAIRGVLGISRDGVDFGAPDGTPVHILMLIVTPDRHEEQHLKVMAGLATMVSDEVRRARLITAADANEAWEVIEDGDLDDYNYFLEVEET